MVSINISSAINIRCYREGRVMLMSAVGIAGAYLATRRIPRVRFLLFQTVQLRENCFAYWNIKRSYQIACQLTKIIPKC